MCPSSIQIGSNTAEKNSAQTNKQTDKQTNRHYEINGHLSVNQLSLGLQQQIAADVGASCAASVIRRQVAAAAAAAAAVN